MGVVSIYLVGFIRDAFYDNLEQRLLAEAGLLSEGVSHLLAHPVDFEGLERTARRTSEIVDGRVTVVDIQGNVMADSAGARSPSESFADRPEFRWAARVGESEVSRSNPRTGEDTLYVGTRVEAGGLPMGVVIIEVPLSRAQSGVNRIIATIVLAAMVVACLSVALGFYLARRTSRSVKSVAEGARRLAQGDLDHRVRALSLDETQELAAAFNTMAASLREMVGDLSAERNKLSAVLDVMREGVIVVEANGEVALINDAAGEMLDSSMSRAAGSRLVEVVRDHELQQLIARALATGEPVQAEVELLHRRRFLSATRGAAEPGRAGRGAADAARPDEHPAGGDYAQGVREQRVARDAQSAGVGEGDGGDAGGWRDRRPRRGAGLSAAGTPGREPDDHDGERPAGAFAAGERAGGAASHGHRRHVGAGGGGVTVPAAGGGDGRFAGLRLSAGVADCEGGGGEAATGAGEPAGERAQVHPCRWKRSGCGHGTPTGAWRLA